MIQLELPMDIPTIPYITVIELWGGPPRRMFLARDIELLPWSAS